MVLISCGNGDFIVVVIGIFMKICIGYNFCVSSLLGWTSKCVEKPGCLSFTDLVF